MRSALYTFEPYSRTTKIFFLLLAIVLLLFSFYLRSSGLFRGLGEFGYIFHPDEPKQVMALFNFLNGDYVRYYGNVFYDGYPYGLNHLDEYLLRPFLLLFQKDVPSQQSLYFLVRILRLTYSLAVIFITSFLAFKLIRHPLAILLIILFLGSSPLAVTVAHFGTGDIGIDLFASLCFMSLYFYVFSNKKTSWLVICGICVGGAFSAKYNGLLVGIAPGAYFVFEFLKTKNFKLFLGTIAFFFLGLVIGILLFTPNILLDFRTSISNIFSSFAFVKNYNVPKDILLLPWYQKAYLGLTKNSTYILSSLGITALIAFTAGSLLIIRDLYENNKYSEPSLLKKNGFLLALALLPLLGVILSLAGKYTVQPFHFSYLQIPILFIAGIFICRLIFSSNYFLKILGIIVTALIALEYNITSINENFFWRHEDNGYYAQKLSKSVFDDEFFYTHHRRPVRSLFLEPPGVSIFRNHSLQANGLDANFWNKIEVAPLPQIPNPIGNDWIFLNGPTFPKNDRMLVIQGTNIGMTVKRYLIMPVDSSFAGIGVQSGSFSTSIEMIVGGTRQHVELEAHQQKTFSINPKEYFTSTDGNNTVRIIPVTMTVPHDTVWVTFFTSQNDRQIYELFGGGQKGPSLIPQKMPKELNDMYLGAMNRIRFLEHELNWRVTEGTNVPMWEVAIPAGSYKFSCDVEGITDTTEITIGFEDAKGQEKPLLQRSFSFSKGIQRIEFSFSKPFAPYQARFSLISHKGYFRLLKLKLTPDYKQLEYDFNLWRADGIQPKWFKRFYL